MAIERAQALEAALRELTAMVRGECPSLLNEDSGGCARLSIEIDALLSAPVAPAGASEPPPRKHRMTCASRLVVFGDDNEPVNCGLPCDCDNPAKWVEVPVSPRAVRVAAEEANGAGGMPGIATRQRGRRGLATD